MNRTSLYLSNANLTPSSYYRLTQYFVHTGAKFHSTLPDCVYTWWHSRNRLGKLIWSPFLYLFYVLRTLLFLLTDTLTMRHDTIIISRTIVPHHLPLFHKLLIMQLAKHNKIIWDFDDNIIENRSCPMTDFLFYTKNCHMIVTTSDILLSLIEPEYRSKVTLLPTTDGDMLSYDMLSVMTERENSYTKEVKLIWVATASSLDYIRSIIPALDEAARMLKKELSKQLSLHIVCNKPLVASTLDLNIVNIRWERERAKQEMLDAHIGIMPLPDNTFTRGKGGFKLIQYMSASLPVVGSNVGFNSQVITENTGFLVTGKDNDWQYAILTLASNWDTYSLYANNARKHYDDCFSYNKNKAFWEKNCKS